MNGNSLLLDSNIVLYLLNGEETLTPLKLIHDIDILFCKK
jgi:hypothetical protein